MVSVGVNHHVYLLERPTVVEITPDFSEHYCVGLGHFAILV